MTQKTPHFVRPQGRNTGKIVSAADAVRLIRAG